jgi:hypothetical protein
MSKFSVSRDVDPVAYKTARRSNTQREAKQVLTSTMMFLSFQWQGRVLLRASKMACRWCGWR